MQRDKAMNTVKIKIAKLNQVNMEIYFKLFDTKILPILHYGAEVWGFHEGSEVEAVHLNFCKYLLRCNKNTSNLAVWAECGRIPLYNIRLVKIIKYWLKLSSMDKERIANKCYEMQKLWVENGNQDCWTAKVSKILCSYGFSSVWYQGNVGNQSIFIAEFKQRVRDIGKQNVVEKLRNTPSLTYYKLIDRTYEIEKYLNKIDKTITRIMLTRLRLQGLPLLVHTGKMNKIPRSDRKCIICNSGYVEDEYHFVLVCHIYMDLRQRYLGGYYCIYPEVYKLIQLLESTCAGKLRALGEYVFFALKRRRALLDEMNL
jgi:hypothetical protein